MAQLSTGHLIIGQLADSAVAVGVLANSRGTPREFDAPSGQGRGTVTMTDVREARPDPSTHSTVRV